MSAAEKLEALDEELTSRPWRFEPGCLHRGMTRSKTPDPAKPWLTNCDGGIAALRNALPQIVAVVKAMAENEKEASSPTMMSLRHLENIAARSHAALAALDDALSA